MEEPRFEQSEIAGCAACIALIIVGGFMNFTLVTFPCGGTLAGLAV